MVRTEPDGSARCWRLPPWLGVHSCHRSNPSIEPLWLSFAFLVHSHHRSQPTVVYLTSFCHSLRWRWAPLILTWLAWCGPVYVFHGWYVVPFWGACVDGGSSSSVVGRTYRWVVVFFDGGAPRCRWAVAAIVAFSFTLALGNGLVCGME